MNDNGTIVDVNFNTSGSLSPVPITGGGGDYWQNLRAGRNAVTSAYSNFGAIFSVDNIPDQQNIIRLSTGGTQTLAFIQTISDIYIVFVNLNNNVWTFTTEAILMSVGGMNIDGNGTDSNGYWGGSSSTSINDSIPGEWGLRGSSEPHGTLVLPGDFDSLT